MRSDKWMIAENQTQQRLPSQQRPWNVPCWSSGWKIPGRPTILWHRNLVPQNTSKSTPSNFKKHRRYVPMRRSVDSSGSVVTWFARGPTVLHTDCGTVSTTSNRKIIPLKLNRNLQVIPHGSKRPCSARPFGLQAACLWHVVDVEQHTQTFSLATWFHLCG